MHLILLKIFIHDLVVNISTLSIKYVIGTKSRGIPKNEEVEQSDTMTKTT